MKAIISRRLAALEAFQDDAGADAEIPWRVYTVDAEGRRTYRAPDADDLAWAARYAPKGKYHDATS